MDGGPSLDSGSLYSPAGQTAPAIGGYTEYVLQLIRRGLLVVLRTICLANGWLRGALALLAIAGLWNNWLQFHPWLDAAIVLVAGGLLVTLPHDAVDPPALAKPPAQQGDVDEAYRIVLARSRKSRLVR